jgi:Protein of unknown function (DUF1097)
MSTKLKLTAPLAITIAVIAFLYVEFAANFSFHWVTDGSLGNGLDMPAKFHLIIPAAFLTWGMFFVLGANNDAVKLVAINTLIGCGAALVFFIMVHAIKKAPDFWGIALSVGILAFVLTMASALSDLVNVPTIFVTFGGTVMWWLATGFTDAQPGRRRRRPEGRHDRRPGRVRRGSVDALRVRRAQRRRDDVHRPVLRLRLGPDRRADHSHPGGRGRRPARRGRPPHDRLTGVRDPGSGVDS